MYKTGGTEQALRFIECLLAVLVTRVEEQIVAYRTGTGFHMQAVSQSVVPALVFIGNAEAERVVCFYVNLPDVLPSEQFRIFRNKVLCPFFIGYIPE